MAVPECKSLELAAASLLSEPNFIHFAITAKCPNIFNGVSIMPELSLLNTLTYLDTKT